MNKKIASPPRLCRHCRIEIPREAHASRIFCENEYLDNGTLKSCKDDFYNALWKEKMQRYNAHISHQRMLADVIEELFNNKGEFVTTADIDHTGVILEHSLRRVRHAKGLHTFYFLPYAFEQLSLNTFKIFIHDAF